MAPAAHRRRRYLWEGRGRSPLVRPPTSSFHRFNHHASAPLLVPTLGSADLRNATGADMPGIAGVPGSAVTRVCADARGTNRPATPTTTAGNVFRRMSRSSSFHAPSGSESRALRIGLLAAGDHHVRTVYLAERG